MVAQMISFVAALSAPAAASCCFAESYMVHSDNGKGPWIKEFKRISKSGVCPNECTAAFDVNNWSLKMHASGKVDLFISGSLQSRSGSFNAACDTITVETPRDKFIWEVEGPPCKTAEDTIHTAEDLTSECIPTGGLGCRSQDDCCGHILCNPGGICQTHTAEESVAEVKVEAELVDSVPCPFITPSAAGHRNAENHCSTCTTDSHSYQSQFICYCAYEGDRIEVVSADGHILHGQQTVKWVPCYDTLEATAESAFSV